MKKYYDSFCGFKVSEYGLEKGYVDYGTLAKCFDAVLCNNIPEVDPMIFDNIHCGDFVRYYDSEDNEVSYEEYEALEEAGEECYENQLDIFQYFIVEDNALWYLEKANELVLYSEVLDCYIWCVTHYGTHWNYVLTDIKLEEIEGYEVKMKKWKLEEIKEYLKDNENAYIRKNALNYTFRLVLDYGQGVADTEICYLTYKQFLKLELEKDKTKSEAWGLFEYYR